jgi:hypothetical protein
VSEIAAAMAASLDRARVDIDLGRRAIDTRFETFICMLCECNEEI